LPKTRWLLCVCLALVPCIMIMPANASAEIIILDEMHETKSIATGSYFSKKMDLRNGDLLQLVLTRTAGGNFDVYLLTEAQLGPYLAAVAGSQEDFGKPTDYTYEAIGALSKWITMTTAGTYYLVVDNTNASSTGAIATSILGVDISLVLKRDVSSAITGEEDTTRDIMLFLILALSLMSFFAATAAWSVARRSAPPKKKKKPVKDEDELDEDE